MNEKLVSFFPSGNSHLVAVKDNYAAIYSKDGSIIAKLEGHAGRINSVDVSPDGKFIVTSSNDELAYIWNYNLVTKQYSIYDTLSGHNGIVWSCRFNKTGKYIITASADSNIKIWDMNGKQINPALNFFNGYRSRKNNREADPDRFNPQFSQYYGKFCDASFSHDEKEIIATGYAIDNDSVNSKKPLYYQLLFFDGGSGFLKGYGRSYFFNDRGTDTVISATFRNLSISPDNKVAEVLDAASDKIFLLTGDGRKLMTLPGKKAMFSANGNELFWCNGNVINTIPVPPHEIKRLLERFKISDNSKIKEENFLDL
jgi:WD40 repeat protein